MISLKKVKKIFELVELYDVDMVCDTQGLKFETVKDYCRRYKRHDIMRSGNHNVLLIPDLHAPFIRKGYLEFCIAMKKKWNCKEVYFLGDLLDNHYMSFHDTDPDGYSANDELERAIVQLDGFHKAFPVARVVLGNHDNIPDRKAFNAGLSKRWIKGVGEVLGFKNWEYKDVWWHNNIMMCHGIGMQAHTRMKNDMVSVIQGHFHSKTSIIYQVGVDRKTFAMQLGCGIDNNTFAMAYGKWYPRQHINIGVLLEGKTPLIEYMDL